MFRIPMGMMPMPQLKRISKPFYGIARPIQKGLPNLQIQLKQAEVDLSDLEYVAMCMSSTLFMFVFLFIFAFFMTKIGLNIFLGFVIVFILSMIMFIQKLVYPRVYSNKRIKNIERNLLPALQNILVQLNAGVPLFSILVSIAQGGYGGVSEEFEKAVREINAGRSQVTTLEDLASRNPSQYFRRSLWQMTNGIKTGTDMTYVIEDTIKSLSEFQLIQIQKYGSQLKPIAMFYLLLAVIAPSLGTTFVILLSSFVAISDFGVKMIFWGLFTFVAIFQLFFMGVIKSRRPNLLG